MQLSITENQLHDLIKQLDMIECEFEHNVFSTIETFNITYKDLYKYLRSLARLKQLKELGGLKDMIDQANNTLQRLIAENPVLDSFDNLHKPNQTIINNMVDQLHEMDEIGNTYVALHLCGSCGCENLAPITINDYTQLISNADNISLLMPQIQCEDCIQKEISDNS